MVKGRRVYSQTGFWPWRLICGDRWEVGGHDGHVWEWTGGEVPHAWDSHIAGRARLERCARCGAMSLFDKDFVVQVERPLATMP